MPRNRSLLGRKKFHFRLKQSTIYSATAIALFALAGLIWLSFTKGSTPLANLNAALTGNFGVPKFWDNGSFENPSKPDPTLPADELEKAGKKVGMWKRRVHTLGLDPKLCPTDSPDALTAFYADAIGLLVAVRVRVEPPKGAYSAKNTIRDYYPDTPELRAKHKLTVQVGGSTAPSFAVNEDGEIEL